MTEVRMVTAPRLNLFGRRWWCAPSRCRIVRLLRFQPLIIGCRPSKWLKGKHEDDEAREIDDLRRVKIRSRAAVVVQCW